jgi:hypothetical protein
MEFYKVCVLDINGNPEKIYEFNGEHPLFSESSIRVPLQIHKDDSIHTIKKKIVHAFENAISYDEIYMFTKIQNTNSPKQLFDSVYKLTDSIDFNTFSQLCKNLKCTILEKKENYTYDDFVRIISARLPENNKILQTNKSLGLQFAVKTDEGFPINPYLVIPQYEYVRSADNRLISLENSVFNQQIIENIEENTIYLCLAENVLNYFERNRISTEMFSCFFPILSNKEITTISDLLKFKQPLLKETLKMVDSKTIQLYETVDLLYDIYRDENATSPLSYVERGISYLDACIYPETEIHIPLDTIFKTVHATEEIPFIKYNPGTRRENIYRLYSTQINKYGKKIPNLRRSKIIQLSKELRDIGKFGQITFYKAYSSTVDIIITITSNAYIYTEVILEESIQIRELEENIKSTVNTILSNIPYPLPQFHSIYSTNVKILKMNYRCILPIKRKFTLFKEGYISAVFQVIEENISKEALMKYRRVDNFEEMTPESSLILNWFNSTVDKESSDKEEFIRELMNFSSIEREQALLKLNAFLRDHTILNGKYATATETIMENAGFLTRWSIRLEDDTILVDIENINSVIYIEPVEIFIDSILRLKQYPETIRNISPERILKASKYGLNPKNIDKPHIENIIEVKKLTQTEAMKFGRLNYLSMFDSAEEEGDDAIIFEEHDDDDQIPNSDQIPEIFNHIDDFEDADLEFEFIEDDISPKSVNSMKSIDNEVMNNEEIPKVSRLASEDIDESDSDSEDEGIVFEGGNPALFPYERVGGSVFTTTNENYERELDGKPLKTGNDNIILNRLKKREPKLFLSKDAENGFFDRYSRLCPAYRQPVILTNDEKEKIDKDHPGSYAAATQYGTDSTNPNWYICPRYWCLKTNTSLTYDQVQSGICGKIIPQGSKIIPPGHYVYEFNHGTQHSNPDGTYHDNKPGFLTKDNHPDGYCLPCCFKEWSKPQRDKQARCTKFESNIERNIHMNKARTILKVESSPLDPSRYGFLPLHVERFLQINHQTEVQADNPSVLKSDGETFLRYGVQQNSKKSFIGCIADLYSKKRKINMPVTIQKMCEIIANVVTIDMFIRVNNGSLPAVFKSSIVIEDINHDEIKNSIFRTTIDMTNPTQREFFQETISAFYAFRNFMMNESSFIDYTYLWDIICTPNSKLFETGLNIAILDITQNDSTDNIALICPSSVYSKMYYDPKKETVIILKSGSIFEPIYLINTKQITSTFFEEYTLNESLKQVLNIIRYSSQNYCAPIPSIPQYEFKRNKLAEEVYLHLLRQTSEKRAYQISQQIINFQGKTIGFNVILPEGDFIFIPSLPSAIISGIPIQYIENEGLWQSYEITRDLLLHVKRETSGNILCQPIFKVIEDGLIIGIITETNQFIQIDEPTENIFEDSLKTLSTSNYIMADSAISTNSEDATRRNMIKRIELESQFYSAFRSFIRGILNLNENLQYKLSVLKYIENRKRKYNRLYCLRKIEEILRNLCKDKIQFYEYADESILFDLYEITNCQDKTDIDKPYCFSIPNTNTRGMLIPKQHLISGAENNVIYFKRISDELFRYKRIQPYLLEPNKVFNIKNIDYQLNNDEMILLQSFLIKEFFENFIPFSQNESTKITYEFANQDPRISQPYSDIVEYSKQINSSQIIKESEMDIICIKSKIPITGNPSTSIWKQMFPNDSQEMILSTNRECSFYPIIYIMRDLYKTEVTISQIKETLRNSYNKKYLPYFDKILKVLKKQGKKEMIKRILTHSDDKIQHTVFEEWILSESYYLTDLDIWVLAQELSLPIILFTSTSLKMLLEFVSWIVMGQNAKTDKYYFIRAYASIKPDEYHDYHLITPPMRLSELQSFKTKEGRLYLKDLIEKGFAGDKLYEQNIQSLKEYFERYLFIKNIKK